MIAGEGALEFYCGSLGSGKTSFAFDRALEHLLKGGTVVTNIAFRADVIAKWMHEKHGLRFDPDRLVRMEDGTDSWKFAVRGTDRLAAMCVWDEAHVSHNARDWNKTSREEVMFNTMVRKLRIHLIYVTQDLNNVDKQFRRMAQVIWYCRNARHLSFLGGLIRFPFNLFFRVPYLCGPGAKPTRMQPEVLLRPESWGMFDSHALVGKAEETFSMLSAAKDSPLQRIKRPPRALPVLKYAAFLTAGAFLFL
jgi:hypothetical protein